MDTEMSFRQLVSKKVLVANVTVILFCAFFQACLYATINSSESLNTLSTIKANCFRNPAPISDNMNDLFHSAIKTTFQQCSSLASKTDSISLNAAVLLQDECFKQALKHAELTADYKDAAAIEIVENTYLLKFGRNKRAIVYFDGKNTSKIQIVLPDDKIKFVGDYKSKDKKFKEFIAEVYKEIFMYGEQRIKGYKSISVIDNNAKELVSFNTSVFTKVANLDAQNQQNNNNGNSNTNGSIQKGGARIKPGHYGSGTHGGGSSYAELSTYPTDEEIAKATVKTNEIPIAFNNKDSEVLLLQI